MRIDGVTAVPLRVPVRDSRSALGDFDLAEEAAQEAFAIAAERWPRDGPPQHPVAWLVATGRNRAIDRVRRDRTLQDKTRLLGAGQPAASMDEIDLDDSTIPDERLELIFTCCHPALAVEAPVALTLRALGAELAARGIKVSHFAVWHFFEHEGISFKKKPARQRAGSARRGAPAGAVEEVPGQD